MLKFGGFGVDVQLHSMRNSADIVWVRGNSYARVAVPANADEYVLRELVHTNVHGERYLIVSVNGIGEERWKVNNNWDLKYNEENQQVATYFRSQSKDR
jgi:hypothetical protein